MPLYSDSFHPFLQDKEELYRPEKKYSEPTTCSDTCSGEAAVTLKIGFNHSEETSSLKQKVKFKIEVYHSADSNNKLVLTTAQEYYIKGILILNLLSMYSRDFG